MNADLSSFYFLTEVFLKSGLVLLLGMAGHFEERLPSFGIGSGRCFLSSFSSPRHCCCCRAGDWFHPFRLPRRIPG